MTHNERVLELLSDGKPHTHHEIYGLFVIGHSRISDLRKRGHVIKSWRDGDDYLYQLCSAESDLDTSGGVGAPSPQSDAPSDSVEQLTLVDVWREGLAPNVVYLRDPDQDNYSRKVGAA